jgi:hypothetical protein
MSSVEGGSMRRGVDGSVSVGVMRHARRVNGGAIDVLLVRGHRMRR